MKSYSAFSHLKNILLLPFPVTVVIPFFILRNPSELIGIPAWIGIQIAGGLLGLFGIAMLGYTIYLFATRGKGTLAPWDPTQKLVITGPYRYCRNPMITGVLAILLGESLYFHSGNLLLWALFFFCLNTVYFIAKEEPDLVKRFGEEYEVYKRNVPRWIPRITPFHPDQT